MLLKKEINLKDACQAWREWQQAHAHTEWASGHIYRKDGVLTGDTPYAMDRWHEAKERETACIEALKATYAPLTPILTEVQKRCTARTISEDDIVRTLIEIEDDLKISKKAMDEIVAEVDINAQSFPSAYKYIPESTHFLARYKSGSWRLTRLGRNTTKSPKSAIRLLLTDAAKEALIKRFTCHSI